ATGSRTTPGGSQASSMIRSASWIRTQRHPVHPCRVPASTGRTVGASLASRHAAAIPPPAGRGRTASRRTAPAEVMVVPHGSDAAASDAARLAAIRADLPALQSCTYLNTGTCGPVPRAAAGALAARWQADVELGRIGAEHFRQLAETMA